MYGRKSIQIRQTCSKGKIVQYTEQWELNNSTEGKEMKDGGEHIVCHTGLVKRKMDTN